MDKILDFMANYYYIFLIVAVVLVFALIGFIAESKRKEKKAALNMASGDTVPAPTPNVANAPAETATQPAPIETPVEPVQTPTMPIQNVVETPVVERTVMPDVPSAAVVEPTPVLPSEPVVVPETPVATPTNDLVGTVPSVPSVEDTFIVDAPLTEPVAPTETPVVEPTPVVPAAPVVEPAPVVIPEVPTTVPTDQN